MISSRSDFNLRARRPYSDGFTLMEIVIVVAILVAVSAMVAPQLMSMVREGVVFRQADEVREVMSEARRYAIDTGIDYEFRYELNGPGVVVLPTETELNVDEDNQSTTTEKYMRLFLELAEDIQLSSGDPLQQPSETLPPERFGDLNATDLASRSWSTPVLFRFDGTAEDFELKVSDPSLLTSIVSVRGLTGATRTSQVYQGEL
ncbi:MAG: prepilin-type N-terminal cleavage/methylation domain-containing protein [Planctomycetaceae bacterium]